MKSFLTLVLCAVLGAFSSNSFAQSRSSFDSPRGINVLCNVSSETYGLMLAAKREGMSSQSIWVRYFEAAISSGLPGEREVLLMGFGELALKMAYSNNRDMPKNSREFQDLCLNRKLPFHLF